ncbi:MAG: hypothetical protein JWO87_4010 [Phycisphaerales bacterium]|jgi:hypothetical protein|nr:hypothetical protein [Phycisphaerales bacterium]MDB5304889.1 hypothetical protein [Phycisphaerales bacterium]
MSECGHCPFLNRSDARCSKNFSLDRLGEAYEFCFGQFAACTVYRELLVERRLRRQEEAGRSGAERTFVGDGSSRGPTPWFAAASRETHHAPRSLVQVTLGGR